MNQFDILIAKNLSADFVEWQNALDDYANIDAARMAVIEAARRNPWLNVSLSYGGLVKLLAKTFDYMQAHNNYYTNNGEEGLAALVYRTFLLFSGFDAAHPDLELDSTYPVREDIVKFFDKFVSSRG